MLLKLTALLILSECFVYKRTDFGPSFDLFGFTVSPDRFVFIIILICAAWKLRRLSGSEQSGTKSWLAKWFQWKSTPTPIAAPSISNASAAVAVRTAAPRAPPS